ncbi:SDR family oxidoreductase [Aureispira sp. CCB-QB1]|uniref:SDR family oxidoreductase n=1 Tax=Aureispira sp. CCB-QB1 TaxID=1313421 RepID=UPI0006988C9F|nr:SDR family oxidoreductase [Aureispira sp. CCB-QB1]
MQRILITGALGYLGQIVLKRLHSDLKKGNIEALVAMDVKEANPKQRLKGVVYIQADIRDKDLWKHLATTKITSVIHLAAIIDSQASSRAFQYEVDVLGTQNILDACLKVGAQRIVISSSGAAYGYHADNPSWLKESDPLRGNEIFAYSAHKRQVEAMLAEYRQRHPNLEQVVFRVCTILGASTQNLITNLFDKKRILGIKNHLSPYVFVWDEDVATCMHKAVFSTQTGIYNLAGDGAITNADLAKILGKPYWAIPARWLRLGLKMGRRLGWTKYGPDQILFIQYRPVLDNRKLKEEFGYIPQKTSLETFLYYLEAKKMRKGSIDEIKVLFPNS